MENVKQCKGCKVLKPCTSLFFYRHHMMTDGFLGHCIECVKARVKARAEREHAKVCAYDRARAKEPKRKAEAQERMRLHRAANPDKYKARTAVGNALRDGRLFKQPCRCGSTKVQAHHHDYSKPLDVEWLCFRCHREDEHGQRVEVE